MRAIGSAAILAFGVLATLSSQSIPQDTGAAGASQKIQKVRTTASVLHGTAHPDDEHGGVLATPSRGDGARVILLTLTRRQRDRPAAVRGPRAHSHRRVADRRQVLRHSYANIASFGLSYQRSQNGGRFNPSAGSSYTYYTRAASRVTAPEKERSIFDGIDTTYSGLSKTLGQPFDGAQDRPAPVGVDPALAAIDAAVARAASTFTFTDPATAAPALAEGLRLTRDVIAKSASEADAPFVLRIKERQFQEAISAALGLELTAVADPNPMPSPGGGGRGGGRGGASTMSAPVPGQTLVPIVPANSSYRHCRT